MSSPLAVAFSDVGVDNLSPEAASALQSLAVAHSLQESTLAQHWETFAVTLPKGSGGVVTAAALPRFTVYLAQQQPQQPRPRAAPAAPSPLKPKAAQVLAPPTTTSAFAARGAKLQAAALLNGHLPCALPADAALDPPTLLPTPPASARFMNERTDARVDFLESRLLSFSAAAAPDATDALHAASSARACCVGRVVCDSEGGRLNEASVLLEGSAQHSSGARVRLDLRHLPHFSLFPGQAVVVRGVNPSGFCFVADTLVSGSPGPRPPAQPQPRSLSLVVAAGPFSCSGDSAYEPLAELLAYCEREQPDVLLLQGPFVDAEHPLVAGGQLPVSFDELFDVRVRDALEAFAASQGGSRTAMLLQPSVRDAHHSPVFPTPPFAAERFSEIAPGQLLCTPNPAVVQLAGGALSLGACATDVLKALSGSEAARAGAGEDRLGRLAGHLAGQACFYPLAPPPLGTNLDASRAAQLAMPFAPNLLVLPSDLAPFAKVLPAAPQVSTAPAPAQPQGEEAGEAMAVDAPPTRVLEAGEDTVCVNPGRLARGSLGGSFAHIHVQAAGAPFSSRVRVDLVRV